jgi:peptidyl-prolyl cis-trans isomerase D
MLQTMRKLAHSWVFKGLMMFLVLSFGIWGIGDIFRGNPLQRTVAKTGNASITVQQLSQSFQQGMQRARSMFGPEFTVQQALQNGIYEQTLDNLIARADIEQDLDRLGIKVSNQQIVDKIAAQTSFRDKNGKFDKEAFRNMLAQQGMSENNFMDSARSDLSKQQLFGSMDAGSPAPKTMVDEVYRARGQKRIYDIVTVKDGGFANIPVPDDQTLQSFYDQNAQKFMAPEYRGLTIIRLSADDQAKDINISDDDLKKAYDARQAELAQPERRDLLQVVVQNEDKAKQLASVAQTSHDLSAASKIAGNEAVPLNGVDEKSMPASLKAVFTLKEGQISDPIKTELGWHVVQVKKITAGYTPTFDQAKDKLRETIKHDQAIESVTRMVNQLDDELAAGHALEDIADSMKLRLIKVASLDEAGKSPDGKEPTELPQQAEVLKNAFQQNSGEVSPVLDDRQGNYVVVRTDEIMPAAVPPLEKIKDKVLAQWKATEQAKKAAAAAEEIAKGLREGRPASSFAAESGVDVRVSKPISVLGDSDPEIPPGVVPQILGMKKGEVVSQPLPGKQMVLRLADVVDADMSAEQAANQVKAQLDTQMPVELKAQYVKYLRILFPVDINQGLVESLKQQGG